MFKNSAFLCYFTVSFSKFAFSKILKSNSSFSLFSTFLTSNFNLSLLHSESVVSAANFKVSTKQLMANVNMTDVEGEVIGVEAETVAVEVPESDADIPEENVREISYTVSFINF